MTGNALEGKTLIVGAGIFGVSTAYHLSLLSNHGEIIILDQHDYPTPPSDVTGGPLGASHDQNKIVRADYTSKFHMKIALEAIERWKSWDTISPYYHRSGWLLLATKKSGLAATLRQNFLEVQGQDIMHQLTFDEARQRWNGAFRNTDISEFDEAWWNPEAGWAEADKALEAVLGEAVKQGARYEKGKADRILLGPNKSLVKGVLLTDGSVVEADRIILATGAWTSSLMSSVEDDLNLPEDARIENQVKAAGVANIHFNLAETDIKRYKDMPVIVHGSNGEGLPYPRSKLLKFNNAKSFLNMTTTSSGHRISKPVAGSQNSLPRLLREETLHVAKMMMPQLLTNGANVDFYRLCWDAITPQQHQLITKHPDQHLQNLYLAVGGSFHGWKFLPTIGYYVANIVRGLSNGEEMDKTWGWKSGGWNAVGTNGAHAHLIPTRTFQDFEP